MDKIREIRAILSGRVTYRNGAYAAADSLRNMRFQGFYNGSLRVSLYGVGSQCRRYYAEDVDAALMQALESLIQMGRPVTFSEDPDAVACLYRPLGNPLILTLEPETDGMTLEIYTARTPLAQWHCSRAVSVFERNLPEELRTQLKAETVTEPKPAKENRRTRKARRKADKWARKAGKAEAKTAKAEAKAAKIKAAAQAAQENMDE